LRIPPRSFAFTALLGLFAALPAFSVDLSAPTLPLLPRALGTSVPIAGLTLSLFMVGFAVGQLGAGSLSDTNGRRPVLLAGLACFTAAGFTCALASTGATLALARSIQGFGAGACSVISFAMIQDLFEGDDARSKRSYVTTIFCAVPILAPALGSVLIDWFGWRSVHGSLALAGGLLLLVAWICVDESRLADRHMGSAGGAGLATPLWKDSGFIRVALTNALSYGGIFAYIAGSPVAIIGDLGYSSRVFAAVFASTAVALAGGAWTSGRLSRRGVPASTLVTSGLIVMAGAAFGLMILAVFGVTNGAIIIPILMAIMYTRGVIAPNLQHIAIEQQGQRAGLASAALGVSQLLAGALASAAVAVLLPLLGPIAVAVGMALPAVAALVPWCLSGRKSRNCGASV